MSLRPADTTAPAAASATACREPRRRRRWLVLLGVIVVLLVVHRPLLLAVGRFVVVEQISDRPGYLVVWDGDRRYERAGELYRSGASPGIVLVQQHPNRAVRLGVLPPAEDDARRELEKRGVPAAAIELIGGDIIGHWPAVRALGGWLQQHPDRHVTIFCRRFNSRDLRYVVDHTLTPDLRSRVAVWGLPDRIEDETRWWQTKRDLKGQFHAWLQLAFDFCQGEPAAEPREWDFDAFEKSLTTN